MKKMLVFLGILGILMPQGLFAQMENPEDKVTIIDSPAPVTLTADEQASLSSVGMGAVMCSQSQPFGSVKTTFKSSLEGTVPGANISFDGTLRNENETPLVGGKLILRILKKNGANVSSGAGYDIIDQFNYADTLNFKTWEEKKVSVSWHVPEDVAGGEYFLVPFVVVNEHIVSGLYFTDIPPADAPKFTVTSNEAGGVFLDKGKTTLNGQNYAFTGLAKPFPRNERVIASITLTNPKDQPQVVRVSWNDYLRNNFNDKNLQNQKIELIELGAYASKEISYESVPKDAALSYLSVTAEGQYQKSTQNIRFVREGVSDAVIETATLEHFTLETGEPNSLSACVLATALENDNKTQLVLTLHDQRGNVIHTYSPTQGMVSGVNEFRDEFTPTKNYGEVTLTATLTRDNGQVSEMSTPYSCVTLSGGVCYESDQPGIAWGWKKLALIFIILLPLIVLVVLIVKKQHSKNRFKLFLALFIVGAALALPFHKADAAMIEVSWVNSGPRSQQSSIAQNSNCAPGWVFTNVLDDNINSKHLLGESDTASGLSQMCIRADDSAITLSSQWTTTGCSGGNTWTGVWDDAGLANWWNDDSSHIHNINEENFRPNDSRAYSWCLGASGGGATSVQTRWVEWASSTYYPPCAVDETILLGTHRKSEWFRFLNMNYEDTDGANQRSLCAKIVVVNTPPNIPTLTGPTSGSANVAYPFTTRATDPESNAVRYGIDWDNNNSVDEWTSSVASGSAVVTNHLWIATGVYTFKALAEDSNGARSGWSIPLTMNINPAVDGICGAAQGLPVTNPPTSGLCTLGTPSAVIPGAAPGPYSWTCSGSGGGVTDTCFAPYILPAPTFNFQITDPLGTTVTAPGNLTVNRNDNLNIVWNGVTNATGCTGLGAGWDIPAAKNILGGNDNVQATANDSYVLTCTGPGGTTSKTIAITIQPTLKIC
ncbi:MAG: hypothetical protein AAB845_01780, partial [Patescibacteria group bacterium]